MEMYLFKSAACLAILLLFYKLLLERENMHVFKRFFLLAAPVISFGIPIISFPEYITISSVATSSFSMTSIAETAAEFPLFEVLLSSTYVLGVIFFGSRFIINLRVLLRRAKNNPKVETPCATQVLLQEQIIPHTFWSYIYLNREKFEHNEIPQQVMDHELAHVRQKHTADIIFMEFLQIFLWFLPLVYLLKKAVRLNHEFLADSAALRRAENIGLYQKILLSFSSGQQNNLVNSINYQSIKKRFTIMKKQTSQKSFLLRTFIFLPLLAALLYGFSDRETVVLKKETTSSVNMQEEATPQMVAEYNQLARHYREQRITEVTVQEEGFKRMMYIFKIMTRDQRKAAEKLPSPPPPVRTTNEVPLTPPAPGTEKAGEVPPPPPPPGVPALPDNADIPIPPPPPPVAQAVDVPAPPPPPPSPEQSIKNWMKEGALFYFNGKAVSGKEALKLIKETNGRNISLQVRDDGSKKTVRISDNN